MGSDGTDCQVSPDWLRDLVMERKVKVPHVGVNRQFQNPTEAKVYVLGCLISTLENDIDGNGADYLYDNLPTEEDRVLAVDAARQVLKRLQSMVGKNGPGKK